MCGFNVSVDQFSVRPQGWTCSWMARRTRGIVVAADDDQNVVEGRTHEVAARGGHRRRERPCLGVGVVHLHAVQRCIVVLAVTACTQCPGSGKHVPQASDNGCAKTRGKQLAASCGCA